VNVLVILAVAMASIAFYIGLFHLLSYARRRNHHEDFTFALTSFSVGLYAAFSAELYSVSSTAEGMQWQRGRFFTLALVTGAFLWFVSDYTGQVPKRTLYVFLFIAVVNALNQVLFSGDLIWIADKPLIKDVHLPFGAVITYYEVTPGPLSAAQSTTGLLTAMLILWATVKFYRHGNREKARPLLLALGLLFAAALNDTAVAYDWYEFIYLIEFAYMGVVLMMAYSLTNTLLEAATAKEALRDSEEKYRTLFEMSPESIVLLNLDGTILDFNPATARLGGWFREMMLNRSVLEASGVREEDKPRFVELLSLAAAGKLGDSLEFEIMRNGQEPRQIESHPVLLRHGDEPYAILAITRDVTERKQVEQALHYTLAKQMELGELRSRIITTTSHEFRTPLATILSTSEILQDYADRLTEHKRAEHFGRIRASVQYITALLDDALAIDQIQSGELVFRPASLDIAAFCQQAVTEMRTTQAPAVTFDVSSTGDCAQVVVDKRLLRYVVSNLLSNAVKFSPPGGTVAVQVACDPEQVVLKVQDHGVGIPEDAQAQLFTPFYRATNIGEARGMGLGLAIVKECVDLHGGTITLESKEGWGTTFTVMLPRFSTERISAGPTASSVSVST
jgi:PAS domain S-box-containing protein